MLAWPHTGSYCTYTCTGIALVQIRERTQCVHAYAGTLQLPPPHAGLDTQAVTQASGCERMCVHVHMCMCSRMYASKQALGQAPVSQHMCVHVYMCMCTCMYASKLLRKRLCVRTEIGGSAETDRWRTVTHMLTPNIQSLQDPLSASANTPERELRLKGSLMKR